LETSTAFSVDRTAPSVLTVRVNGLVRPGFEFWTLLLADAHEDNPHCDRKLLYGHLDEAVSRQAAIASFGDWFDAMQSKGDKRHTKADLLPEYLGGNYTDLLVDNAAARLKKYKEWFLMFGEGNHEWGFETHMETSLTQRLCTALDVERMYEWGFIRFLFRQTPTSGLTSRNLYFHHGSGGGGPVTRGVIASNRRNAMLDNTDIVVSGHIHERWILETPVVSCTQGGRLDIRDRLHLQLGTYKQEFTERGFHVRNQRPPKPLGGTWLRFFYDYSKRDRLGMQAVLT
jgi:hypothetical protein